MSPGGPGDSESRGVVEHAAGLDLTWLTQYGARTGSTWVHDVFAARITDGALDAAGLREALVAPDAGPYPTEPLVRFARMLASTREVDRGWLTVLLDHLVARLPGGKGVWRRSDLGVLAELCARAGRTADVRALLARRRVDDLAARLMEADATNPWCGGDGDEAAWLALVNQTYVDAGLAPLRLEAEGATPFDRLGARTAQPVAGGPLVTVLMSCFRPGPEAVTAVRSVVAQTWPDWELLVLDDASGAAYDDVLGEIAALDDRVRVVRATANAGTYTRRNEGLAMARGELVTIHDSDDWSHPQRFANQVAHLREHPERPANWLSCLRSSERLELVNDRTGRVSMAPAEPTLMFRRRPVVDALGYWDPIRRAADREYRQRVETVFGVPVPDVSPEAPLQLYRVLSTSLSSPDFTGNWVHPARIAYRSAFTHWHRAIAAGTADAHLAHPLVERPYPAPARFMDGSVERHEVDVLVLLDVRPSANPDGGPHDLLDVVLDELETLLASGTTLGVAHVESLAGTAEQGVFPERLEALVQAGRVARVLLEGDETTAGRVVVRTASVLQGQLGRRLPVTTSLVVLVEDLVSGRDRRGENLARTEVEAVAATMFGVGPGWVVGRDATEIASAYTDS